MFVQRQSRPSPSFLTCVDRYKPTTSDIFPQISNSVIRKEKIKKSQRFLLFNTGDFFLLLLSFRWRGTIPSQKGGRGTDFSQRVSFFFSWIFNRRLFTPLIDLLILSRHFLFPFIFFNFFFLKDENPVEWSVNVWDAKEKETVGIESMQWIHQHFYKRWSATCWEAPTFFFPPIARLCCCCCSPATHNSSERERESLGPTYSLLESITAHTRLYSHRCNNHHSKWFYPFHNCERIHHPFNKPQRDTRNWN